MPTPEGTTSIIRSASQDRRSIVETLAFRQIAVVRDEYAVSEDGMRMFGVLDLETSFEGCRFSIGIRNSNDKSMRLAMTVGYRVFVCDNMASTATSVLYSRNTRSVSASSMRFPSASTACSEISSPCACKSERGRNNLISNEVKLVIYRAFVEEALEAPKHLARRVHDLYFNPQFEEFAAPRDGAWRMPSPRHSRSSIRFRNSKPRRNSAPFLERTKT